MAKYCGKIGYSTQVEDAPGYIEEKIVERKHYGDIVRNARKWDSTDHIVDDFHIGNSISILADSYAIDHAYAMRYVTWMGARWKITRIDIEPPRLILTLGGLYNGPEPDSGEVGESP